MDRHCRRLPINYGLLPRPLFQNIFWDEPPVLRNSVDSYLNNFGGGLLSLQLISGLCISNFFFKCFCFIRKNRTQYRRMRG